MSDVTMSERNKLEITSGKNSAVPHNPIMYLAVVLCFPSSQRLNCPCEAGCLSVEDVPSV